MDRLGSPVDVPGWCTSGQLPRTGAFSVQYGMVGIVFPLQFCGGLANLPSDQLVQFSWSWQAFRHAAAVGTWRLATTGVPLLPAVGCRVTSTADASGNEAQRLTLAAFAVGLLTTSEKVMAGVPD